MNEEREQQSDGGEIVSPEVVTGSALERIERASVDAQVSTAHQYPRSMQVFKRRAMEMVTLDEETAQSCIYRRPVGKKGGVVEYAEGKSIRMAEIVGACYGNLRVGARIVEMTPRYVKAQGVAHDLESNFSASSEVVESTVTSGGQPYSERMRMVVAKAALSKARRDATFQVVPAALCKSLEDAARTTAIGTVATLGKKRQNVLAWINLLGIEAGRVWAALGVKGVEDVTLDHLETLTGIRTAIKDKEITADEAFPIPGAGEEAAAAPKPAMFGAAPAATPPTSGPAPNAPALTVDPDDNLAGLTPPAKAPDLAPAESQLPTSTEYLLTLIRGKGGQFVARNLRMVKRASLEECSLADLQDIARYALQARKG